MKALQRLYIAPPTSLSLSLSLYRLTINTAKFPFSVCLCVRACLNMYLTCAVMCASKHTLVCVCVCDIIVYVYI